MASLKAEINIVGTDMFQEILAIVQEIVHDIDVPERHKVQVQQWAEAHRTDYALDHPIDILATHAICPLCGMGRGKYEQKVH